MRIWEGVVLLEEIWEAVLECLAVKFLHTLPWMRGDQRLHGLCVVVLMILLHDKAFDGCFHLSEFHICTRKVLLRIPHDAIYLPTDKTEENKHAEADLRGEDLLSMLKGW